MTSFVMWPQVLACFIVLLQYLVAGDQIRGIPGVDYPTYTEIPRTSFRCSEHGLGFFADLETRCQVFHHCYEHRRESFLCPPGTIFNQGINACDYWYSAECTTEDEASYQPVGKSADAVYEKIASLYEKTENKENVRTEVTESSGNFNPYAEDGSRQHESSSDDEGMEQMVFASQIESQQNEESQEVLETSTDDPNLHQVQFDVMDQNMGQFKFVSENPQQEEQFQQHQTLVYDEDQQTYEDNYYFENEDRHQLISDPNDYSDSNIVYLPIDAAPDDAFEYADDDYPLFLRRDSSTSHRPPRKSSRPRPVYVEVEPSVERPTIPMPTRKRIRLNQNQQQFDGTSSEDFSNVQTEPSEMTTVATIVDDSDRQANLENSNTETDESEYPMFYTNDEFGSQEHGLESSENRPAVTDENFSSASFEYIGDGTANSELVTEDLGVENEETPFYSNGNYEVIKKVQSNGLESLDTVGASMMDEGFQNENLEFDDTTDANTEWQVVTEHLFAIADETSEEQLEYDDGSHEFSDDKEWDLQEHAISNENSQFQLHPLLLTTQIPIETSEGEVQQTNQNFPAEMLNFEEFIPTTFSEPLHIDHKQDQSVVEYADDNSEDLSNGVVTEALNDSDVLNNKTVAIDNSEDLSNGVVTEALNDSDVLNNKTVLETEPIEHFHEMANITNEQSSNFTESKHIKTSDENIQQIDHKISDQPFFHDHSWPELSENPPLPSDFDSIVPPVNTLEHENKESLDKFFNHQSVIISELSPNTVVDSSKAFPSQKVSQSVPQKGHPSNPVHPVVDFNQVSPSVSQSVEGPPSNPQVFGRSLSDPRFMNFGFNPNSNYLDTVNFPTLTRQLFSPFIQPFNTGDDNIKSRQLKDDTTSTGWSSFKLFAKKLMTSKKAAMDTFRAHYNSFDE